MFFCFATHKPLSFLAFVVCANSTLTLPLRENLLADLGGAYTSKQLNGLIIFVLPWRRNYFAENRPAGNSHPCRD
jgi:hypothetical protein